MAMLVYWMANLQMGDFPWPTVELQQGPPFGNPTFQEIFEGNWGMCSFLKKPQTVWVSMFHGTNPLKHGNRSQQHSSRGNHHNRLPTWSPACLGPRWGLLSIRAIETFNQGPKCVAFGLKPCCLPSMHYEPRTLVESQPARSGHAFSLFFRGQGPNRHKSS